MKRQDRDSPPMRGKRGRPMFDHEMMRDRVSPDFDRRDGRGKFRGRDGGKPFRDFEHDMEQMRKPYRDDRMMEPDYPMPPRMEKGMDEYRSLCISGISSKMPDPLIKDLLHREFEKFGEMNVKVTFSGDQRVAYVNFRYPADARVAKNAKSKLVLFDRQVRVQPVFNKKRVPSPQGDYVREFFPPVRGMSPPPPMGPNRRIGGRAAYPEMTDRNFQRGFNPQGERRGPEKFPFHLNHVDPEFDDKATRTLFVGNLDVNIGDLELKRIFEKFGVVEDVDIKRPQGRGQGNAYAFIKFMNLDCAHRAKVEMSGKYIGKFQCKIGYGKVTPTTCLWVGGLGPWVTHDTLERELDRFGVIHRIEWPHGKSYAYVLYDSIDAAQAACQEMRGFPMGGTDRRLRVDFADPSHMSMIPPMDGPPMPHPHYMADDRGFGMPDRGPFPPREPPNDRRAHRQDWIPEQEPMMYRNMENPRESDGRRSRDDWEGDHERRSRRPRTPPNFAQNAPFHEKEQGREEGGRRRTESYSRERSRSTHSDRQQHHLPENQKENGAINLPLDNLTELAKLLPVAWNGALILKSSAFAARMHVVSGNVTLVDNLMRDPTSTETPVLRITQRLRLDQPKLEDVRRRIEVSGSDGHCILLAQPSSLQNWDDSAGSIQQRPLKNLVSYLKQKEAAGVISLPPNPSSQDRNNVGVLHAFPPCQFGFEFLTKRAPKLAADIKDEYLVVVVVCGVA